MCLGLARRGRCRANGQAQRALLGCSRLGASVTGRRKRLNADDTPAARAVHARLRLSSP